MFLFFLSILTVCRSIFTLFVKGFFAQWVLTAEEAKLVYRS